jgi:hypothetical protein
MLPFGSDSNGISSHFLSGDLLKIKKRENIYTLKYISIQRVTAQAWGSSVISFQIEPIHGLIHHVPFVIF